MAEQVEAVLVAIVLEGEETHGAVVLDGRGEVPYFVIEVDGDGGAGESRSYLLDDLACSGTGRYVAGGPVGERYLRHRFTLRRTGPVGREMNRMWSNVNVFPIESGKAKAIRNRKAQQSWGSRAGGGKPIVRLDRCCRCHIRL